MMSKKNEWKRRSFSGGVLEPGQRSEGVHPSGFPIYNKMNAGSGKISIQLHEEEEEDVDVDADVDEASDDDFYDKLVLKGSSSSKRDSKASSQSGNSTYDSLDRSQQNEPSRGLATSSTASTKATASSPAAKRERTDGLKMPTSMQYSEEGSYDNLPFRNQKAGGTMPRKGKGTSLNVRADGQDSNMKAGKASRFFTEAVVHESDRRKAFLEGQPISDPDKGRKCKHCSTCPGFDPHYWRKVCKWCRCPRHQHSVGDDVMSLNLEKSVVSSAEGMDHLSQKYAWVPVGVEAALVEEYFRCLPPDVVPLKGSKGERWRKKQLLMQCPVQDTDFHECDQLTQKEFDAFKAFDQLRLREAFDIGDIVRCPDFTKPESCDECFLKEDGTHWPYCSRFIPETSDTVEEVTTPMHLRKPSQQPQLFLSVEDMPDIRMMKKKKRSSSPRVTESVVDGSGRGSSGRQKNKKSTLSGGACRACSMPLKIGEVVVQIGRFDEDASYLHPQCVVCTECQELLVDLRCYVDVGWEERSNPGAEKRLFCGRHWADNRKPRCVACDETIQQKEHVFELDAPWHFRHFSCFICDTNLTQKATYIPHDNKPLCVSCYQEHLADKCTACGGPIDATRGGGGKITVGKFHWHPNCFTCRACKTTLKGKPCVPKGTRIYCKECYKLILKK